MAISKVKAENALKKGFKKAKEVLKNDQKIEELLQKIEAKLKTIPVLGEKLAYIPIFASLLRSYFKKEYTEIPLGSIIAITSALIYFVSPIDLVPDFILGAGLLDDAAVVYACHRLVESDINDYVLWRRINHKEL